MPKSSHVHTIRLPLRRICSALPALALISGGVLLAPAAPAALARVGATSKNSTAIVVPDVAMTNAGSAQITADPFPLPPSKAGAPKAAAPPLQPLVSMLSAHTTPGSSAVTLDSSGIPVNALDAYRKAASLVASADPGCHIDWALLGAVGRVESDHGRFGGNRLDPSGEARPGIFGPRLDGTNGAARILDTDHGVLDHDTVYDRAVGPMQFIPSTWRADGVDANGDGVKDPQNMADAAASTAVYLCSGKVDLSRPADLRSAILRYNDSDSYASMVTAIAGAYRLGVRALPASELTPARPAAVASKAPKPAYKPAAKRASKPRAKPASKPVNPSPGKTTSAHPIPTRPSSAVTQPGPTVPPSATISPTSQPAPPATTVTQSAPAPTPLPSMPTCVPTTAPTSTVLPTPTATPSLWPTSTQPC